MNYYEKIIQEKRNDLSVVERGTIRGAKYFIEKITGYKRSVYRGSFEKDGRVVTTTWTCDTIDECKKELNKLRDTDALLNNSKEEKDNTSVQDKFSYKGCLITILKKGEGSYSYTISQNGREEGTNDVYPTQDKAEAEAKREVEINWNEKEEGYYAKLAKEKKNTNPEDSMRKLQALKPIVEAFKRKGMTRHEVAMRLMQERDITETLAQQCVDTWY